jgi:arginine deiminase
VSTLPERATEQAEGSSLSPWVASEAGRLRTVLLHRPGRELERITPENMHALLFDDVPWASRAQAEHDAFAAVLRSRGVRVLELQELLAETLVLDEARAVVLDGTLAAVRTGPFLGPRLREWLDALPPVELAERLIAGVAPDELPFSVGGGMAAELGGEAGFVLPPLPNHFFTRDTSVWVRDGVGVGRMARLARDRESVHLSAILRHHPLFAESGAGHGTWRVEGGDVLVPRPDRVLVGLSERTTAADVDELADGLFAHGIEEILAFELPLERATMHLDTLMTFVDHDAVVMHPDLDRLTKLWRLRPSNRSRFGPRVDACTASIAEELSETLATGVRVVGAGAGGAAAAREQWSDAFNVLAIAPGVVLGYDRNEQTNAALADDGVEVLAFAGGELGRGRGGARCMSCPIERDDA